MTNEIASPVEALPRKWSSLYRRWIYKSGPQTESFFLEQDFLLDLMVEHLGVSTWNIYDNFPSFTIVATGLKSEIFSLMLSQSQEYLVVLLTGSLGYSPIPEEGLYALGNAIKGVIRPKAMYVDDDNWSF